MTTLSYNEPELIIALKNKAIFVNPNDLQIFKEVVLPTDLSAKIKTPSRESAETDNKKKVCEAATTSGSSTSIARKKGPTQKCADAQASINGLVCSPGKELMVVTTAGVKALLLYHNYPVVAKLLSVRALPRASSALAFAPDSATILVTDKNGDCYQFDCVNVEAPPRLLFGHLSIVYGVLWSPDAKYIITCDRDDKIRVTNYPLTYNTHTYCLGHKEFVSDMALLAENELLSVSGDATMRIWNYETGEELNKYELPAAGLRLHVCALETNKYQVGVQLHQLQKTIVVYELSKTLDEKPTWQIKELKLYSFGETVVTNFCFVTERLYVAYVHNEKLNLQVYNAAGEVAATPENWLNMVHEQFADNAYVPENYSERYRKQYDNVKCYLERKQRRIEESEQKAQKRVEKTN